MTETHAPWSWQAMQTGRNGQEECTIATSPLRFINRLNTHKKPVANGIALRTAGWLALYASQTTQPLYFLHFDDLHARHRAGRGGADCSTFRNERFSDRVAWAHSGRGCACRD